MAEAGPMSGFRDLLAEDMIPREAMLGTVRGVFETYGFVPLKTPALERYETMTGKYGEEGEKLMYSFHDFGDRHVAMRYDQTVPLARVVAQHGHRLPKPYKRYAIGDVWRGDSPQAGRYREFTQFDADTVGSSSYLADTEIVAMMSDAMGALDLDTTIRVNDRRILDGLAKRCGITEAKEFYRMIGILDKIDKIGSYAVVNEIETTFGTIAAEVIHTYTSFSGDTARKIDAASDLLTNEEGQQGLENISRIMGTLVTAGYSEKSIIFDATIARGLDYYTGTIYETMLNRLPSIGSVCSGGRFDNLIQDMGGPATPAVGTALGVDRLLEGMRQLGTLKPVKTNTTVFMTNIDTTKDAERFAIVQDLRKQGIATELILGPQKFGKQLRDIDGLGVTYALLYGSNEAETQTVIVKDLQSGEQTSVAVSDLANYFKTIKGE